MRAGTSLLQPPVVVFILHTPPYKLIIIKYLNINIKSFALEEVLRQNLVLIPNVVPDNRLRIAEKDSVMVERLVVRARLCLVNVSRLNNI